MFKTFSSIVCLLVVFSLSAVSQTPKFGHFDSGTFLSEMPEAQAVEKTLNEEASKIESQLSILQEDFKKEIEAYQKNASTMTDAQREAKEIELQGIQERIQVFVQTSRTDIQKKQQELMQPILQKVLRAVQEVGANGGYTYIFERQASLILYNGVKSEDIAPLVKKNLGLAN